MKTRKAILTLVIAGAVCCNLQAKENLGTPPHHSVARVLANGCPQDEGAAYLDLNNVRARIMDEGDMFWNTQSGLQQYFVPAGGKANSQFAAAPWIGGLDAGGQLKIAAMTYRQNGEDYWAGPLDTTTVSITLAECQAYDKMFPITRAEVQNFVTNYPAQPNALTSDILNWPGNGNQTTYHEAKYLAPFVDVDDDGLYIPQNGDYPAYDLKNKFPTCQNELFGDQTLWWVMNDEGNNHSETGGVAIGLEIRCQAFEFATNDAINNCTFYNYQIINRSSYTVNQCYFGAWDDVDLGNGANDYVGCDVGRGLGYTYNGTPTDPDGTGNFLGEVGYHDYPPAIGVDFFQGPHADKGDTSCYVSNGLIGMARFVYFKNDFSFSGNPENAQHYYNYLKGVWKDGTPMTYGGTGYQSSSTPCNYMFPWTPPGASSGSPAINTDPTACGTHGVSEASNKWDMVDASITPNDMRFIQSAGPFTLKPGAVNYITVGDVWDQTSVPQNNLLSVGLIQTDDDLAQALFNNCFRVLDGPNAPDLTIQELKNELIITLTNPPSSNNYKEGFKQKSSTIPVAYKDTNYVFEGYQLFQVADSAVTAGQLLDPTQARLVAECDIKNGVTQLVNYTFNATLGGPVPTLEVVGADKGIVHSFDIKTDLFQQDGISTLVNDRFYYYICVAYAYNNYCTYNPNGPDSLLKGLKMPYLQGAHNGEGGAIKVFKGLPHVPTAQGYGTKQNSYYGQNPEITRIEGRGNGITNMQLDPTSISYILQNDTMAHPVYSQGPIDVEVVDPLSVPNENFIIKFYPMKPKTYATLDSTARWKIYIPGVGDTVYSDTTIGVRNEQILPGWGLSITIRDNDLPGNRKALSNGSIDSVCTMTFADPTKQWLSGVPTSGSGVNEFFWIRSGTYQDKDPSHTSVFSSYPGDSLSYFQDVVNGTWSPYYLAARSDAPKLYVDYGPKSNSADWSSLAKLCSVDVVLTSDQSKWTRCPVVEEQDETVLAQGGATKLSLRKMASIAQDGHTYATLGSGPSTNPADPNYIADNGMGWFPGYAINVETGERLNMAFGEDSWLAADNGRDMIWNPDSIVTRANGDGSTGASQLFGVTSVMGGKHYIYIFGHNTGNGIEPIYDNGKTSYNTLKTGSATQIAYMWGDAMWVNIPLLVKGHTWLETDVTIHLRVSKPYATDWGANWSNATPDNDNWPMYEFGTAGLAVDTNSSTMADSALNLINIVPNPYYAYSQYESDRLHTTVRLINLPPVCTISIFTLAGNLVRVINKEGPLTYIDWNLLNQYGVPISSGLYIINVNVPNVGQKTLKWFGVMRPLDLNSY